MLVNEMFIKPRRIKIHNQDEEDYYIKIYNKKKDLYKTVYSCKDSIEVNNTIVDKIFLDFDFNVDMQFLKDVRTVAEYLYNNDYLFYIRFSGNGFHIFILLDETKLKNPKVAIKQYVDFLHKETNTTSDPAVVGDLRRVARIPNTLNLKHKVKHYCISIKYDELMNLSYEDINKMALNPRCVNDFINGHRLLNISEWDNILSDNSQYHQQKVVLNTEINDELPPCIQEFMKDPMLGNAARMQLILFFRDLGYSEEEVEELLLSFLSDEKFNHSIYEEKQIQHLFAKDYIFSECSIQKQNGLCPSESCKGHGLYY